MTPDSLCEKKEKLSFVNLVQKTSSDLIKLPIQLNTSGYGAQADISRILIIQ